MITASRITESPCVVLNERYAPKFDKKGNKRSQTNKYINSSSLDRHAGTIIDELEIQAELEEEKKKCCRCGGVVDFNRDFCYDCLTERPSPHQDFKPL